MCEPMWVAMGMQGVGTLVSGVAAAQRGNAAREADYRSAEFADQAAADALSKGSLKTLQVGMRGSTISSAALVAQSGSGVIADTAGPRAQTAALTELDKATVRRNAALEAYGLRQRAGALRQEGEYAEAQGRAQELGTFLGGIGGIAAEGARRIQDMAPALPTPINSPAPDVRQAPPMPINEDFE